MSNDQSDPTSEEPSPSTPRKPGLVQVRNHRVMVSRKAVFIFAGSALALAFLLFSFPKLIKDWQVSSLVRSLTAEDSNTRREAFEKLARMDDDVTPWFVEALKDAEESDRATLIKALGSLGATKNDIIPILMKCYKTDPAPSVKKNAALGLCQNARGRSELSTLFMELIKDQDISVKRAAIQAIIETGASDTAALSTLQSLFKHPNKDLARRSAKAFLELAPKDHPERANAKAIAQS